MAATARYVAKGMRTLTPALSQSHWVTYAPTVKSLKVLHQVYDNGNTIALVWRSWMKNGSALASMSITTRRPVLAIF